jgi:ribosomal protein L7/L12
VPCCPVCNHETPIGVRLCPNCGADLPESIGSIQPGNDWEHQIRALLDGGQKIMAIKLYREHTGAGLKEAKDAVEAIQRGEPSQDPEESDSSLQQTLVSLLQQGRKIDAIKVFREVTGSGLKESKDAIESIAARHGLSGSQRTGCLGLIVLLLMIVACGLTLA